jgi:hypothetical protein
LNIAPNKEIINIRSDRYSLYACIEMSYCTLEKYPVIDYQLKINIFKKTFLLNECMICYICKLSIRRNFNAFGNKG